MSVLRALLVGLLAPILVASLPQRPASTGTSPLIRARQAIRANIVHRALNPRTPQPSSLPSTPALFKLVFSDGTYAANPSVFYDHVTPSADINSAALFHLDVDGHLWHQNQQAAVFEDASNWVIFGIDINDYGAAFKRLKCQIDSDHVLRCAKEGSPPAISQTWICDGVLTFGSCYFYYNPQAGYTTVAKAIYV